MMLACEEFVILMLSELEAYLCVLCVLMMLAFENLVILMLSELEM